MNKSIITMNNLPSLEPCPFCGSSDLDLGNGYDEDSNWVVICRSCKSSGTFCVEKPRAIEHWNTRVRPDVGTGEAGIDLISRADAIAIAECHDKHHSSGYRCYEGEVIAKKIAALPTAQTEDAIELQEEPVDLAHVEKLRSMITRAPTVAGPTEDALTESERNDLRRAIAESDIAGCELENSDIDSLVNLFEAWLERRQ